MATVLTTDGAKRLGLPGRTVLELVSGGNGARAVTLRLVEIPVQEPGEKLRGPHYHDTFEECMYVLSGTGKTYADSGEYALKAGDCILMPAGERHVTRNTGSVPLMLLCFFPVPDITKGTFDVPQT
jgi:mannose-6-phosphate isomerase-like protein (cupin superfamily)